MMMVFFFIRLTWWIGITWRIRIVTSMFFVVMLSLFVMFMFFGLCESFLVVIFFIFLIIFLLVLLLWDKISWWWDVKTDWGWWISKWCLDGFGNTSFNRHSWDWNWSVTESLNGIWWFFNLCKRFLVIRFIIFLIIFLLILFLWNKVSWWRNVETDWSWWISERSFDGFGNTSFYWHSWDWNWSISESLNGVRWFLNLNSRYWSNCLYLFNLRIFFFSCWLHFGDISQSIVNRFFVLLFNHFCLIHGTWNLLYVHLSTFVNNLSIWLKSIWY